MKIKIRDDFDDEDRDLFARCGRVYRDLTPLVQVLQNEEINPYLEMSNDILVLSTIKHRLFPTDGSPMLVTNFSSDVKPYNKVGNKTGYGWLKIPELKRTIIWRR